MKTLLVPVTGKKHDLLAAYIAGLMAREISATVLIAHVRTPSCPMDETAEHIVSKACNVIEDFAVEFKQKVVDGTDAADGILNLANSEKANYIIMGSRSKKPKEEALIGDTTMSVLGQAHCPVLVVQDTGDM